MNPSLYHITHGKNLVSILEHGLLSLSLVRTQVQEFTDLSFAHIQDRRARKQVPVGPGGSLPDYVPFHFCPRSTMLGAKHSAEDGLQPLILTLRTDLAAVQATGAAFVFTDGHPTMALSDFHQDPAELAGLDWDAIPSWSWGGPDNRDLRRRKEAEFLVHQRLAATAILEIGVLTPKVAQRVREIVQDARLEISVNVHANWYF